MSRSFLNFIALSSFLASVACVIMVFLANAVGIQVYIPPIQLGSVTVNVDLIMVGLVIAALYAFWQVVQALTPHADPGFERLAFVGSWIAAVGFVGIFLIMLAQKGFQLGNIETLFRTSYPFTLIGVLILIALVDVTFLQWLKGKLHGVREVVRDIVSHVSHGDIVHDSAVAVRGVPLIGHADRASIMYINAAGGELDLEFTADGSPRRLSTRPIAPTAVAAS